MCASAARISAATIPSRARAHNVAYLPSCAGSIRAHRMRPVPSALLLTPGAQE